MTESQKLDIEINDGIEKIKLLNENEKLEVHKLFLNVYKLYLQLPKEEFIDDFFMKLIKKV